MKNLLRFWKPIFFVLAFAFVFGCSHEKPMETTTLGKNLKAEKTSLKKQSDRNFNASLKGRNEVPPVDTKATGEAIIRISKDESSIYFKVIASNIEDVVASHFHLAEAGENGSVVAFLYMGDPAGPQNGILSEGTITAEDLIGPLEGQGLDALIDAIRSGNIYVNVHSVAHPSGEIRGQL